MTIQKSFSEAKAFSDNLRNFLKDNIELPNDSIETILNYVIYNNYLQILYSYQFKILDSINLYFKELEDYDRCIEIRDTVNNHNKAVGTKLKLT